MALISVGNIALGSAAQEGLSAIASSYAKSAETASVPWSAIEYSGTLITAISGSAIGGGGGGPFDSATCSAIASSYAESAASSKLDATASGNFLTSETVTALDTATASFGGATTTVVTSINETYISSTFSMASDHAYSADYDPSGRPLTSLVATSDMSAYQPSGAYLTTADSATILSSSVVTATGGSGSYVTSINGSGISGAGGTTESTVSSIASAYADSAASSKLDKTESSKYVLTSQSSIFLTSTVVTATAGSNGYVTAINGSGLSGAGGGGTDPATVSAIASAYAESAASGKQDTTSMTAYAYESSNSAKLDASAQVVTSTAGDGTYVTSINGVGLSGAGGGGGGDYLEKSETAIAVGSAVSAIDAAIAMGVLATADRTSVALGRIVSASSTSVALGGRVSATECSLGFGWYTTASSYSVALGNSCKAARESISIGYGNTALRSSVAIGNQLSADTENIVFGKWNSTANSANTVFSIGDGTANTGRHNLMELTKDGEITLFSSTADAVGFPVRSAILAVSAASTGAGVVTATAGGSSQVSSINGSAIIDLSTYNSLTSLSSLISENSAKWDLITSVSGLTSITAGKYTLSAGAGISLNNDTVHKVTVISVV